MRCEYYEAYRCRSCTLIELGHADQVSLKQRRCRDALAAAIGARADGIAWIDPVVGPEAGFRTKAKMVVGGTVDEPTLGILDATGAGVDLQRCGLYPDALSMAFAPIAAFIARARLVPYDVPARTGELKNVVVTLAPDGALMVRFVARSTEALARMRKHLPSLLAEVPRIRVVTLNVLPEHKAVVEGEREISLTDDDTLPMRVNGIDLSLRPQSFFQTNTDVAAALYRQAVAWIDEAAPRSLWDLYCGVGGFALHALAAGRTVVGVETSGQAVASAEATRAALEAAGRPGAEAASFVAADATTWAMSQANAPDVVVVNPPRRGIGTALATWLEGSGAPRVIYSSCNALTLASDLAAMPSFTPVRARLLDMFPHTDHYEVVAELVRA